MDLAGLLAAHGILGQHCYITQTHRRLEPLIPGSLGPSLPPDRNLQANYSNPGSSEDMSPPLQPELICLYQRVGPHTQT